MFYYSKEKKPKKSKVNITKTKKAENTLSKNL